MGSKDPQDLVAELRQRPTFAKATNDYIAMLTVMRSALQRRIPGLAWDQPSVSQDGESLCEAPYTKIPGAIHAIFGAGGGDRGVPDDIWPSVRQDLIDLAAKQGFTKVVSVLDRPGRHNLVIYDRWGGSVEFGSETGMSLSVFSPCLLHQR